MNPNIIKDQNGKIWITTQEKVTRKDLLRNLEQSKQLYSIRKSNADKAQLEVTNQQTLLDTYDSLGGTQ